MRSFHYTILVIVGVIAGLAAYLTKTDKKEQLTDVRNINTPYQCQPVSSLTEDFNQFLSHVPNHGISEEIYQGYVEIPPGKPHNPDSLYEKVFPVLQEISRELQGWYQYVNQDDRLVFSNIDEQFPLGAEINWIEVTDDFRDTNIDKSYTRLEHYQTGYIPVSLRGIMDDQCGGSRFACMHAPMRVIVSAHLKKTDRDGFTDEEHTVLADTGGSSSRIRAVTLPAVYAPAVLQALSIMSAINKQVHAQSGTYIDGMEMVWEYNLVLKRFPHLQSIFADVLSEVSADPSLVELLEYARKHCYFERIDALILSGQSQTNEYSAEVSYAMYVRWLVLAYLKNSTVNGSDNDATIAQIWYQHFRYSLIEHKERVIQEDGIGED